MALFVFLVLLVASPVVTNLKQMKKKCDQGAVIQCQDLTAAIQCNAVSRCVKTEWIKPTVDDDTCSVCATFMGKFNGMVKRKSKQGAMNDSLHKGCNSILIHELEKQCHTNVDLHLSTIIRLLKEKKKPKVLCAALGLCKSRPLTNLPDAFPEDEPDGVNDSLFGAAVSSQPQDPKGEFTCDFCILVLKKLNELLSKKKKSDVCSLLPGKDLSKCHRFMKEFKNHAMDQLHKKATPNDACDNIHLCSKTKRYSGIYPNHKR